MISKNKQRIQISLYKETLKKLDIQRGKVSRSEYMEIIIWSAFTGSLKKVQEILEELKNDK